MATTNLGLYQMATTSPDYEGGTSPLAAISAALSALDGIGNVQVKSADGAITITQGLVVITKSSTLAALTLAKPTAGLPSAGGNDGQVLRFISTTAKSHTVTTPTNGINGASTVITFTAAADYLELTAYGTSWYITNATPTNVAITT